MSNLGRQIGNRRDPQCVAGAEVLWLDKKQTALFKTLFKKMQAKIGNWDETRKYIGINRATANELYNGLISTRTGRKILAAYKRKFP